MSIEARRIFWGYFFMGRIFQVVSLAVIVLSAGMVSVQAQTQALVGDYYTVRRIEGAPTVPLGGTVIPYKQVTLTAQLPGRVKFIGGIEGDRFKKNDLLVAIDEVELLAKRNAALAQLANADSQLRAAGVQYNRELWAPKSKSSMGGMGLPNLFDQMFVNPMENMSGTGNQGVERRTDLYSSGIQITQAQNTIMAAESQLQVIDSKLRDAKSLAPFDGVLLHKHVEVGDTMQPGMPLLVYGDLKYLQLEADVPARMRPGISEGMMLQARLDVGDQLIPVRVAQIFPMADTIRHTVKVKFDLPEGVSAPGMYAKVLIPDFTAPTRNFPVIPSDSISYNGSLPGVYVIDQEGKPQLRMIRVGESLNGGFVSVLSGLAEGERVLRNPAGGVSSGWGDSRSK